LGAQRRERLASEADDLAGSLRRRTVEGVFSIARKALGDIASTGLEASACDTFNARLRAQDAPARGVFARALTDAAGVGRVRSAFDLPEAQRGAIRGAVDEVFALRSTLSFETAPDLVCGIEIAASGQKISWSFDDELTALERGVGGLLRGEPGARATAS
jgi:F-type H+-transporting ATPase subunit b